MHGVGGYSRKMRGRGLSPGLWGHGRRREVVSLYGGWYCAEVSRTIGLNPNVFCLEDHLAAIVNKICPPAASFPYHG